MRGAPVEARLVIPILLAVAAMYPRAALFGSRAALIATFAAVSRWHMSFSRWAKRPHAALLQLAATALLLSPS